MQQKYLHAWNRKRHKCFHRQLDRDVTTRSGGEKYEGIGTRGVGGRPRSPAPVAARRLRETAFACGGVRPSVRSFRPFPRLSGSECFCKNGGDGGTGGREERALYYHFLQKEDGGGRRKEG